MERRAWIWCLAGGLSAGLAVVLGASAAHWAGADGQARAWIEMAQSYHLPHALGLILIGVLALQRPGRLLDLAGLCLLLGSLCFCGGLYLQGFGGLRLGPVIPLGGGLFIAGWLALAGHCIRALSATKPGRS